MFLQTYTWYTSFFYCLQGKQIIFVIEIIKTRVRLREYTSHISLDLPVRKSPQLQTQQVSCSKGRSQAVPSHYMFTPHRRLEHWTSVTSRTGLVRRTVHWFPFSGCCSYLQELWWGSSSTISIYIRASVNKTIDIIFQMIICQYFVINKVEIVTLRYVNCFDKLLSFLRGS
jgi:hypothetical protein